MDVNVSILLASKNFVGLFYEERFTGYFACEIHVASEITSLLGMRPKRWTPPHVEAPLLSRLQASQYLLSTFGLRCEPSTLAKLATVRGGPPYYKSGDFRFTPGQI